MNEEVAKNLVREYIEKHLEKTDSHPDYDIFTVWKCYILGSQKYLISSTLPDGMYYELTYDNTKNLAYLDAYKKFDNEAILI